jgi:hypothetical protein
MTPPRQRMLEDLQLRGLSERTQELYVRAVRQLAAHYHKSPDRITEEALRDSFLSLKNVRHSSRSANPIALCGLTFFYEHTLKRAWSTLSFVKPHRERRCRSSSAPRRCGLSSSMSSACALGRVSPRSMPVACGCKKAPTCRSPILTVPGCSSMCAVAKAPKTARGHCRSGPWRYCARTGPPTAIPSGSFPPRAVAASACPLPPHPCQETVYRTPFGLPSQRAGSISGLQSTPSGTALPPLCWRPGCLCASSRRMWDITRRPRRPSRPISPSKPTPWHVMPS